MDSFFFSLTTKCLNFIEKKNMKKSYRRSLICWDATWWCHFNIKMTSRIDVRSDSGRHAAIYILSFLRSGTGMWDRFRIDHWCSVGTGKFALATELVGRAKMSENRLITPPHQEIENDCKNEIKRCWSFLDCRNYFFKEVQWCKNLAKTSFLEVKLRFSEIHL